MLQRAASRLSRRGTALACALALGASVEALAQDTSDTPTSPPPLVGGPPPPAEASPPMAPSSEVTTAAEASSDGSAGFRRFGVLLDVGVPDGIGVSAVGRPLEWLRLHGGLTSNTLSIGLRGGVSLVPLSTFIAPTLNADFGHYFDANYNKLMDRLGGSPLRSEVPIDDVGYSYASASLGLELGSPNRFAFYLRVGLSYASLTIDDADALFQDIADDPDVTAEPLSIRFTSPTVKLGFLFYFF